METTNNFENISTSQTDTYDNEANKIADVVNHPIYELRVVNSPMFGNLHIAIDKESSKEWFCLSDVCKALGLQTPAKVKQRLQLRGVVTIYTPTYNQHGTMVMQKMTYINEPNLYRCIFQSRKTEAEKFQNWVFETVLPQIRKTGAYSMNDKAEIEKLRLTLDNNKLKLERAKVRMETIKLTLENAKYKKSCNSTYAKQPRSPYKQYIVKATYKGRAISEKQATLLNSTLSLYEYSKYLKDNGINMRPKNILLWLTSKRLIASPDNCLLLDKKYGLINFGFYGEIEVRVSAVYPQHLANAIKEDFV